MGELIQTYIKLLNELTIGDLIEFIRGPYSHWGVYLGNEKVAHLAGEDNDGLNAVIRPHHMFTICGMSFDKAKVCIDNFWKIVGKSRVRKNNSKDSKWRPLEPAEIVENATSKLGHVEYNVLFSNCEHFAKWCRYGISKSDQVDNFLTGAAVGFATALTVGAVFALKKYLTKEEEEEKRNRNQLMTS